MPTDNLRKRLWDWRCRLQLKARLSRTIRRQSSLISRKGTIARYLASHPVRKVQIGCGLNSLQGWLNTDFDPGNGVVFLDATQPLPIPDASIDYLFSEHMFEHISYRDGSRFLHETYRVLKGGGRIRIATPDLLFLIRLHNEAETDLVRRYIKYEVDTFVPFPKAYTRGNVINNFFYSWGHQFIYDFEMLSLTLADAGFTDIVRVNPKESGDPELRNLESHGRIIGDEFNLLESIVVEARKPC